MFLNKPPPPPPVGSVLYHTGTGLISEHHDRASSVDGTCPISGSVDTLVPGSRYSSTCIWEPAQAPWRKFVPRSAVSTMRVRRRAGFVPGRLVCGPASGTWRGFVSRESVPECAKVGQNQ
eukprot:2451240-Rhodomonas_salina.2